MKRRAFLRQTLSLTAAMVAAGVLPRSRQARAAVELRLLTWEGYAEDAWVKNFEQENGAQVVKTYVGSNDEYMAKLAAGGGDYDLVVIVSSLAKRAIDAGFVEPLDTSLIPNLAQLYPRLQKLPFIMRGSDQYGAPTFLAITPVTVNAEVIPTGDDFGILFDKKYAGKLAMWDDVSTIGDVAAYMDLPDIWNLTDEQLAAVKAKLIEQKPLLRTYWSQAGEAIDLFMNKEIVASNSWSYITATLKSRGAPVRDFIPKRPLGAIDSHFIVKGSQKRQIAHKFINHILSADSQAKIVETTGYSPTNPHCKQFVKPETWANMRLEEGADVIDRLTFWEDIPRRAKYLELLNEVKAS